ncbi:hypothetical protein SAMN00120144_1276 [Hymenobacter roseosalivarius DSM 11622]|uniref:Secretion system C-terminal sorting domain-containing protein n=1 Tax=Hymenobacter roseosalivarius DSM 11622 TaxID=645990 RepID=A0A1W1W4F2_9BACT|nr:T9SS type A sorting domain-containing protein [Hymenobacter roseosalivarius]SMC00522.1 hypothetical protein SAMN00120144_1276 [Hymenobacter roseosalivarius DSM 11622]
MKKLFTLAAAGVLTATSLDAQAQAPITVNGQLAATEVSANGYQLVGRYTGNRGFGDAGLLALYAASDATNLYFFLAGTLENNASDVKNSIQLFIDRPGATDGVSVGTRLPAPAAVTAPAVGTSFAGMTAALDLAADLGIGIKGTGAGNQVQVDGIAYTSATAATAAVLTGSTPLNTTGTPGTIVATGALAPFAGAMVAYNSSANLSANPGFASNGNAPSNGLEIMVSRVAMGIPAAGGVVRIFAVQNNQDGSFLSTDFIPQRNPVPATSENVGSAATANFTTIPGTQAGTLTVGSATLTVLSNRSEVASKLGFSVYPNPSRGAAKVEYNVLSGKQSVSLDVYNGIGQLVRTLSSEQQSAGRHSYALDNLSAGAYYVKLQVGSQATSQKVIVE